MTLQMIPVTAILQFSDNFPKCQRRRRATGSANNCNGGKILVLFLLLVHQVSSSQSLDECNHYSRSQDDSELLVSFSQLLEQLQPLENLFSEVCAGENEAWQTVHEELMAVSHLARSIQERIPRENSHIVNGKIIPSGRQVKPIPVSANLNPFGAAISFGSTNKPTVAECKKLTPKINMEYINIVRGNTLILDILAKIDGCTEEIQKQVDTDLNCQCTTPSTSNTTLTTTSTIKPTGTSTIILSTSNVTETATESSETSEVTLINGTSTTAYEGPTVNYTTTTSSEVTAANGTTTTSSEGTTVSGTTINGTTTTSTEGTHVSGTTINGTTTTTTEVTPVSGTTTTSTEVTAVNGTTTTSTEVTPVNGTTTTSTEVTSANGTTTTSTEVTPVNGTTSASSKGTTVSGITSVSSEGTHVSGTTINGTTTTSTEITPANGTATASTEGTPVSGTTINGTTTTSTEITPANGTTTASTGSTSNATCVTLSANITAEINSLNKALNDIQSQIQGVTQALIECSMDKNALEKAKVLTETLRNLLQRLQGILERLQGLQSLGQPQARLIPVFLRSFNVPSLRGVYIDQEEVNCTEDLSSFHESFAAIDEALGYLAEDPTNSSKADSLYCSGTHLVDTASHVMRGPQVRQGSVFEEADLANKTKLKIDEVIKRVVKVNEENENRRISLEQELSELNVQSKEIERKLIQARSELEEQEN
ncbi:unnamed protein product [Meganyctiphanes norvegica]|uniref:Uncharacterized protein n=1 Tax=Meganyctiphanes norvegica TaxID=48144 RepID=A0AAV2RY65_MEGNR